MSRPSEKNIALRDKIFILTRLVVGEPTIEDVFPLRLKIIGLLQATGAPLLIFALYNEWPKLVEVCTLILAASYAVKSITRGVSRVINNDEEMFIRLHAVIDGMYEKNERHPRYRGMLDACMKKFDFILKICIVAVFMLASTPMIGSWAIFLVTGKFVYFIPMYLPLIDPQTIVGFVLNMIYMSFIIWSMYLTLTFSDYYILYLTLQLIPMTNIIALKMQKFGEDLVELRQQEDEFHKEIDEKCQNLLTVEQLIKERNLQDSFKELNGRFLSIIKDHQAYNDFISLILEYMQVTVFISLSIDSFCIGMSMLILRFSSIYTGVASVAVISILLTLQCIEGTIVDHQNEKLLTEVYRLPWYELSMSQKKTFLQFIHSCQHTTAYSIPIVGDLNMELFIDVAYGAYSFLMYLIQFVKVPK